MKYTSFQEQRFRTSVTKALTQVQSILDNTRHPRLAEDEDHIYADKFTLAELVTNTAVAAQMNAFERLGLDGEKLQTVINWVHTDHKTVTLRLEASDSCSFFKERDVDVITGEREVEVTTSGAPASQSSTGFLSSMTSPSHPKTETTKVKVITKVKEYHWKVEVTYRVLLFPGTDTSSAVELQSRSTSTYIVTSGGQAPPISPRGIGGGVGGAKPPTPIPESTQHPPVDVNITWFLQQIEPKEQLCQFQIDRNSVKAQRTCKTPRRNENVDAAFEFYQQLFDWTRLVQGYLLFRVEREISGAHNPVQKNASGSPETVELGSRGVIMGLQKEPSFNGKSVVIMEYSAEQQRFRVEPIDKSSGLPSTLLIKPQNLKLDVSHGPFLTSVSTESLFCPILPLMENSAVFGDVGDLLNEQCRSLDGAIDVLTKRFPPRQLVKLVSVAEATLVLVAQHLQELCTSYQDGVDYIENMLKQQLVQAIGKEIQSKDFDQFMVFHNAKIFGANYAPTPFTYSVRRPGHYPDGSFTIECTRQRNEPIHTLVRHVPRDSAPSMWMPINATTSVELTGDRFLHGWMLHRFKTKPRNEYQLIARARQFSSFLLVVGTLQGPNKFDPKDAIVLQNKDEILIPLLTTTLPSAKEFKDSIASLSPEQKAFAQSYRNMQLESSVFGVCIIQLKPQLEKLLGLPEGALTKEIQLTQDLMSLFVEYQIPSDLLTFDGPADSDTSAKVSAVKGYVKSINDVIDSSKEKQLVDEERKADMRVEMATDGASPMPFSGVVRPAARAGFQQSHAAVTFSDEAAYTAEVAQAALVDTSEVSTGSRGRMRRKAAMISSPASPMRPPFPKQSSASTSSAPKRTPSLPSLPVRLENVQPPSQGGSKAEQKVPFVSSEGEDFTIIPKLLDAKMEKFDTDNTLRSTIIKAGSIWTLNRQDNLLTPAKTLSLSGPGIESEKTKAFDLLDAISRSGALPIDSCELHVVIGVSHCFDNDLMGSIIQDNVNPIEKVEKSTLMIASTIYGNPPMSLLKNDDEVQRLTSTFPELGSDSQIEIYADQE